MAFSGVPPRQPKYGYHGLLKPHLSTEEISEEGNDTDSKSDSDKVPTGANGSTRHSIYACQKKRRLEAQAAFQKQLEERRKSKAAGISKSVLSTSLLTADHGAHSQPIVPSAQCLVPVKNVEASTSAQLSPPPMNLDSGYVTRKEVAPLQLVDINVVPVAENSSVHSLPKDPSPVDSKSLPPIPPPRHPSPPAIIVSPADQYNPADYFIINGQYYRILNVLGKGGSSQVFQVYDEAQKKCLAVKRVDLSEADPDVVIAYRNEIQLLQRLQKYPDRVVRMFDYEYLEEKQQIYVVLEKGDTDLASLFKRQKEKLTDQMIAFYWSEMLKAVQVIHDEGIIHSDLKPANFLLVAGSLKLIDFGIANAVPANKTSITREFTVGTLNYISPEAVTVVDSAGMDAKTRVNVKSDVWSLGCILYNMVYGKTPFEDFRGTASKVAALINKKCVITYPPANFQVIDVMKRCLERDCKKRASIEELLKHPYLKAHNGNNMPTDESDDKLRMLAETIKEATPRTGARMIKAAMDQVKIASKNGYSVGQRRK